MREITYEEAEKLLLKHLSMQKEGNRNAIFKHSKTVSDFLYSICNKMEELHLGLEIDCEKMKIAGLLHDIGKNAIDPDIIHAETGFKILSDEGLEEIGKIIRTHSNSKELSEVCGLKGFVPETIEEKLLTYADCHAKHDKIVSFEERYLDVLERSKEDPIKYNAIVSAKKRIQKIIDEIDELLIHD